MEDTRHHSQRFAPTAAGASLQAHGVQGRRRKPGRSRVTGTLTRTPRDGRRHALAGQNQGGRTRGQEHPETKQETPQGPWAASRVLPVRGLEAAA